MPNRIQFSTSGKAVEFYKSLPYQKRQSRDTTLDYIRDVPFEHGDIITKRFASPVVIYTYTDEQWRIMYTLSTQPGQAPDMNIEVFAIGYQRSP